MFKGHGFREDIFSTSVNKFGSLAVPVFIFWDYFLKTNSQNEKTIILLQIFIGGWSNQKSAIRRDHTRPDKANVDTPDILSNEEFRGFWVTYLGGVIAVGRENEVGTFVLRSFSLCEVPTKILVTYFT